MRVDMMPKFQSDAELIAELGEPLGLFKDFLVQGLPNIWFLYRLISMRMTSPRLISTIIQLLQFYDNWNFILMCCFCSFITTLPQGKKDKTLMLMSY